jgi:parallel beta-helix repeat protein
MVGRVTGLVVAEPGPECDLEGTMMKKVAAALVSGTLVGLLAVAAPALAHGSGRGHSGRRGDRHVLWASPSGGEGFCTPRAPCSLANAVSAAAAGDTVVALPGLYQGGVVLDKRLTLRGWGATIDATTSSNGNGVQIVGPGGSGSRVVGFRIENAKFEGILIGTAPVATTTTDGTPVTIGVPVTDVTIAHNVLVDNGSGFGTDEGQCFSTPEAPGDCGETIHLVSVTDSTVKDNRVVDNLGGILLTDEFGPTSGNVIRGNYTLDNTDDCGITLAGHSAAINPGTGVPTGAAGVFDNLVEDNVSNNNGVAGQGAGILMGGGAPFAGVYDNVIRDNVARGNGLAGVAIHQHLVGDLNGNVIVGNSLSNDNLDGDFDFAAVPAPETTGILVASGAPPGPALPPSLLPSPITGTVIRGNRIFNVEVGIWTLGVDPATTTITQNVFGPGVATPVSTN